MHVLCNVLRSIPRQTDWRWSAVWTCMSVQNGHRSLPIPMRRWARWCEGFIWKGQPIGPRLHWLDPQEMFQPGHLNPYFHQQHHQTLHQDRLQSWLRNFAMGSRCAQLGKEASVVSRVPEIVLKASTVVHTNCAVVGFAETLSTWEPSATTS